MSILKATVLIAFFLSLAMGRSAAQQQSESQPCSFEYENHNFIDYGPLAVQDVKGTVTDPQRGAVPKACVGIFTDKEHKLIATAESDADGRFLLPNIPPGRFRLVVKADPLCAANVQLRVVKSPRKKQVLQVHMNVRGLDSCSYVDLGKETGTNRDKSSEAGIPLSAALPNLFPDPNQKLVGVVVLFDSFLGSHTSRADFVLRTQTEGREKYIRLLYAAPGFGFDAPAAKPETLLPQRMFSDSNLIWTFIVHLPRTAEEQGACTGKRKVWKPAKGGGYIEVERYAAVPGVREQQLPKPESLECLIVRSWPNDPDSIRR